MRLTITRKQMESEALEYAREKVKGWPLETCEQRRAYRATLCMAYDRRLKAILEEIKRQ